MTEGGLQLARDTERRIWLALVLANMFAVALVSVMFSVIAPFTFGREADFVVTQILPAAWIYFIAAIFGEAWRTRRLLSPVRAWLVEERAPTAAEWQATIAQPRRQAIKLLPHWLIVVGAGLYYALVIKKLPMTLSEVIRSLNAILVAALNACLLSYLLVERVMRPVLARAHAYSGEFTSTGLGLASRLAIALLSVAGTPMVSVINTLAFATPQQVERTGAVAIVTVAGGSTLAIVLMLFVGRALTEPLNRLRDAMTSVGRGDLGTALPVDESGEIGQLQAGFNEMVEGLRERERMRDVFGRHVGAEVAQRALAGEFGLGGERCDATAVFVDIIGSTGMAEREDPDDVVAILNTFFDAIVRAVGSEGGIINKFQGDGAMCVFGTPIARPDHADRGLRAARALASELASLDGVSAAIGVSSGEVVAGNVGAADRYEFTVIGDPVNEASRLRDEAKARPSRTLASGKTIERATAETANWRCTGAIALRGRTEPTEAYEPRS